MSGKMKKWLRAAAARACQDDGADSSRYDRNHSNDHRRCELGHGRQRSRPVRNIIAFNLSGRSAGN